MPVTNDDVLHLLQQIYFDNIDNGNADAAVEALLERELSDQVLACYGRVASTAAFVQWRETAVA